ncbi:Fe-S cluster assembly protein SufB [Candidatus Dependentiae bacterium HGW-Dependentiae-1]|nr:MAG: Fe-S cluster assembly protein SufB [Candidatus Dependentiae bacterium HGW-Dependentiae-1]
MSGNKKNESWGPTKKFVQDLSARKHEPGWMTDIRLQALSYFQESAMPAWGPDLSKLDARDIHYYVQPPIAQTRSWEDIPLKIKSTFDYLGLPHAEREFLAGLGVQYESEMLYKNLREEWASCGVIFVDTDTGLAEYPELFKKHFGSLVPAHDNKFAALNTALWSGGSFVYVPAGVALDKPLQAYFRIEAERTGQFERTLIIAEDGASIHYVEGCSAPIYRTQSLHCGVVELIAKRNARVRYTTIQNWSTNVYNLVTKRALAHEHAVVEWIDGNIGSAVTMKYPSVILQERGARASLLSLSFAGASQQQDTGGAMIHRAPDTHSFMLSKAISKQGGHSTFRGKIIVEAGATGVTARSQCDALLLDGQSHAAALPVLRVAEKNCSVGHEGSVSALDSAQLFYLMSRGLSKQRAYSMMVNGFVHACLSQIPSEYAIELQLLLEREMEGL